MDVIDYQAFLAGLRNGLGFTKSCHFLRLSPKEVTQLLRNDAGLHKQAVEAITYAGKALLVNSQQMLAELNFPEWKRNMARIQTFIYSLTLWEDYAKADQVTEQKVTEAYMLYRDWDETATAIGFSRVELNFYLFDHPGIYQFIRENEHLFRN